MNCHNHPADAAAGTCAGCAEPFCPSCLVTVRGASYCGACKTMAVAGVVPQAVMINQDAKSALWMALVGMFCFGFILGPVAVIKASKAKQTIQATPGMGGSGWANAAILVGVTTFLFTIMSCVLRAKSLGR